MAVNPQDQDLETLLREFDASDLTDLHVRTGEFDLYLSKDMQSAGPTAVVSAAEVTARTVPSPALSPVGGAATPAPAADTPAAELPPGCIGICAPYLGTFYRAPKPGEPNFVELGDSVDADTDLCLVEVMKLFTAVRSEAGGVVRAIFAVDGQMVEEGQLLFALEPVG